MKLKCKSVLTTPAHASAPINSPRPQDIAEIGEVNNCGLQSAVEFADPLGVVEDDAEAIAEMTFLRLWSASWKMVKRAWKLASRWRFAS